MKIAVTHKNGEIFQHFGHCESFKVYNTQNGRVLSSEIVEATEGGHSALAVLLQRNSIDALICGGIGGGAKLALSQNGIKLYGGVSGNADKAVDDLLQGKLEFNPDIKCSHHDSHHGEDEHCHGANGCDCK